VQAEITTALIALGGGLFGAATTFGSTAWQSWANTKTRKQELAQGQHQALTQLHVEHVNQRGEQRRESYLDFLKAVSRLARLTREDQHATHRDNLEEYETMLEAAARDIEVARDPVVLDGPQEVANVAVELCRIPYRLGGAALKVHRNEENGGERQAAMDAMLELRTTMLRGHAEFMRAGSLALNMDGVGNYADQLPWRSGSGTVPSQGEPVDPGRRVP